MNEKSKIDVGYEFDYANETKAAGMGWNDNICRRESLHSTLIAAEKSTAARGYADGWKRANAFRKAHGKPRRRLA